MEGIDWLALFNAMDDFLIGIVERNVVLVYVVLFAIFFSETGLVFMTFLPGDSLLFVAGAVSALGFTLPGTSERHARELGEIELLDILRHARGRHGSTLDYLLDTARALQRHGIHDPQVQALVALARRHGLHGHPGTQRQDSGS